MTHKIKLTQQTEADKVPDNFTGMAEFFNGRKEYYINGKYYASKEYWESALQSYNEQKRFENSIKETVKFK